MSNYSQITSFAPKDALLTGNPAKLIRGAEIDPELAAIAAAIVTKLDSGSLATEVATQPIVVNTTLPTASTLGFRGVPPNIQTTSYTLLLSDMGKMILHSAGAGAGDVFTIPANSAVPYPVGGAVAFANADSSSVQIAITSDSLILAGTTSVTGTRTLAQNGFAIAIKVSSTVWLILGVGLT